MKKVTFIGLGAMGYPMAGHLSKDPTHQLSVWNRSPEKTRRWQKEFRKDSLSLPELQKVVSDADFIITCTGRDEDMEEILFSKEGIYPYLKKGSTFIDHTTTSYGLSKKVADQLKEKGIEFLDAPVSGGESGAQQGTLSIMVGGSEKTLNEVKPLLESYAKKITYLGEVGSGQLTKMVNQIAIAGLLKGLSEAILFAEKEKVPFEKVLAAISGGAAQSWQMDNRAKTMQERKFDFGFAIKWMVKDLGYCLDRAKVNGANLSFTEQIYQDYQNLISEGQENLDTSSLILSNEVKKMDDMR